MAASFSLRTSRVGSNAPWCPRRRTPLLTPLVISGVATIAFAAGCGRSALSGPSEPGGRPDGAPVDGPAVPPDGPHDGPQADTGSPADRGSGGPDGAGVPDGGGADGGPLAAPRPISPQNGAATGTVWYADNLRPLFRWAPTPGAASYDLQVDDGCPVPGLAACSFSSPEIDVRGLTASNWLPASTLPVARERPVGRRYFWRVRACDGRGCGAWSSVRYVDVGRQTEDLDGDGYADLVVGAPGPEAWTGGAHVYLGRPAGAPAAALELSGLRSYTHLGWSVTAAGDLNADGFGDFVVGAPGNNTHRDYAGAAHVYFGGPTLSSRPVLELRGESAPGGFGEQVAAAGDVDGDGYADLVVGEPWSKAAPGGRAYVFRGGAAMDAKADLVLAGEGSLGLFGDGVAGAGDVDGDGHADVLVGAPGQGTGGNFAGRAYLFLGGTRLDSGPDLVLSGPRPLGAFGRAVAGTGDVDGDGFGDFVIGAPADGPRTSTAGSAYLFLGGPGLDATPDRILEGAQPAAEKAFGACVGGAGDLDRDGHAEVLVGAPGAPGTGDYAGRLYLLSGGPFVDPVFDNVLEGGVAGGRFGVSGAAAGDLDGDGHGDLAIGADHSGPGGRVYVYRGPALGRTPDHVTESPRAGARFGVSVR